MKPSSPCKDCKERQVGCHGKCERYADFKKETLNYNLEIGKIHGANVYFELKAKENAARKRRKKK